jgi:hypothetical protein
MPNTPRTGERDTVGLPTVGQEGDSCEQCGSALATDQRYCLNCGWRRGEARVDYERRLAGTAQPVANGAAAPPRAPNQQWTPVMAIGAIALLGVFLLLGVLIGKKDNGSTQTVAAQAPATTTTAANPTDTTASAAPAQKQPKAGKKATAAPASTAPGAGSVMQGGSGSAQGIQTADTNKSPQENAKNGPDVVATQGAPEKLDPNGQAGGGSSATCIGC